jgi:multidrug efflux pump
MNISEPFIRKPVATTLLVAAIALAGAAAYRLLPVSPLPEVEFPTISVSAALPGASPETMASSVATPLERQFGRIASVTEMTSSSALGSTSITLQFDLDRDIDAAARDVQAAINAARGNLPTNLPKNPSYRKVNPADSPIFMLALTSPVLTRGQMYDAASTIMAQKLSQVTGVGQVTVGGSSLPGVRIELNPAALNKYGIGLEQVRTVLSGANANTPKGHFSDDLRMWEVDANDQIFLASDYEPLVVAYRNGSAVRISDIGQAQDSVEDLRNSGYANGKPSVLVIIFRQPGANIIDTVDKIRAVLPQIQSSIPHSIDVKIAMDQTVTIRASVGDTEKTLVISVMLVVLVVFVFLRSGRTTFIPSVAVPVSLVGTFGVMYLLGYSLDNLSLMALTISTGFVVDDAIVVIENITRYLEQDVPPFEAALKGAQEVGSTVFTISVSLIAVFIPLLLMGGIVGRLFREFAVTLSVAIAVSMVVSLTATPMMCAYLLKHEPSHGWMYRTSERAFDRVVALYGRTLAVALRFRAITLAVLLATIGLNAYLFIKIPKGFFPQQDNGRIQGSITADQDTSFQAMDKIMLPMINIVAADPAVDTVNGFTGGSTYNTARLFISLKPLAQRKITADLIIARLRPKLAKVPGATLYLQAAQDLRVGGRQSNAQYQFTMQGDNLDDLNKFAGTAQAYEASLASEPILIAAALAAVYIILAMLYESYIHPITIISSLPAASVGALLALFLTHTDLSIIAIIGIILLIGIVKKNAIMMIDFALGAVRNEGKNSHDSIVEACMLRFRPILMTTMAALLGALPLALGTGTGSELRRPLGITIIGGLIMSQLLTLYTTPVVYLYFDSLQQWWDGASARKLPASLQQPAR